MGGEGTRLRPITSRVPKPVAPVVERPFIGYVLENLARHGVGRVIFSSGFLAWPSRPSVATAAGTASRLHVVESEPLGTAGAIKNAQSRLDAALLRPQRRRAHRRRPRRAGGWHTEKRAMGTIYLTPVEDPRRYGLVACAQTPA